MTKSSHVEQARLDGLLYNKFSDFAAFHEMRSMLRLHRPQGVILDDKYFKESETGAGWRFVRSGFLEKGINMVWLNETGRNGRLGRALKAFMKICDPDTLGRRGHCSTDEASSGLKTLNAF